MKTLFLLLSLIPSAAFAGSLDCKGPRGLSYSYSTSDGGAQIGPTTYLEFDKQILITLKPFSEGFAIATFELVGNRQVIGEIKQNDYVTTTFRSRAKIVRHEAVVFGGLVTCKEARYVGPPRP